MNATCHLSARLALTAVGLLATFGFGARGVADTFISGFEGDLSSTLSANWEVYDADETTEGDQSWVQTFDTTLGVTEGTQAVRLTHPLDAWQHGFRLNTGALAPIVASHDTLEFDATASPDATWRGLWVIMQGDGMSWTQAAQVDLVPGQTQHVSISLSQPDPAAPTKNWKAAAAASGGTWWQILFAIMGGDAASPDTYTNFDNIKFGGSPPTSPADFNNDTFVNGADLDIWKTGFETDATGDADDDLDSDGNDFLIWQRELDMPVAIVSAVPEPSSVLLALGATALAAAAARRRRVG